MTELGLSPCDVTGVPGRLEFKVVIGVKKHSHMKCNYCEGTEQLSGSFGLNEKVACAEHHNNCRM